MVFDRASRSLPLPSLLKRRQAVREKGHWFALIVIIMVARRRNFSCENTGLVILSFSPLVMLATSLRHILLSVLANTEASRSQICSHWQEAKGRRCYLVEGISEDSSLAKPFKWSRNRVNLEFSDSILEFIAFLGYYEAEALRVVKIKIYRFAIVFSSNCVIRW